MPGQRKGKVELKVNWSGTEEREGDKGGGETREEGERKTEGEEVEGRWSRSTWPEETASSKGSPSWGVE